jgi:uncharacterized protein YbbK (DUF523 family)
VNGKQASELWPRENREHGPIRLGVSSCLLGAEVRYDGGHKRDRYLAEVIGDYFEWVPVCPEVELGLGVPRPPIRLVHGGDNPRLVELVSGDELTERMESYAREKVDQLQEAGLDGFILKGASPSCGMEGVKVFGQDDSPSRNGVGIFARVLIRQWPDLPVAEEGWLEDPDRRMVFFEQVLRRHRERIGTQLDLDPNRLTELDAAHRLLLERLRVKS